MTTAAMWSGGKDSALAVWRGLKRHKIDLLLCFVYKGRSRAHRVDSEVIRRQAECAGFDIVLTEVEWKNYEEGLKGVFKEYNVERCIFGDIYLQEHRRWIERVCSECEVEAVFPLWGENTRKLAIEIANSIEAYVIAAKKEFRELLGRRFDEEFVEEVASKGIDACGENGEFHTIVVSAPFFRRRLELIFGSVSEDEKYCFLDVQPA